jgi:class 3 adenylate cyclase/tetratricopeptide (TPR) repeat protein
VLGNTRDTSKVNTLLEIIRLLAKSKPDEAQKYAEKGLQEATRLKFKKGEAKILTALGAIASIKGDINQALEYQTKALAIFERIGEKKGIAMSINNIASIKFEQGYFKDALDYYLYSLKLREEIKDEQGILTCLNNIGSVYTTQAEDDKQASKEIHKKALEYYTKASALAKKLGNKSSEATILQNIADIQTKEKDFNNALLNHLQALKIRENIQDIQRLALSYYSVGKVYAQQKQYNLALENYQKGLEIAQKLGDKLTEAKIHIYIAETYYEQENIDKGLTHAQEGLAKAEKTGSLVDVMEAKFILSKLYDAKGDFKLAYQFRVRHQELRDSLFNEQNSKILNKLQTKLHEAKDRENQLKIAEQQRQNQRNIIYASVIGLFLVTVAFLLYRGQQKQKKNNSILQIKNKEIEKISKEVMLQSLETEEERKKSEKLLLNILPAEVAQELKETGKTQVRYFKSITVLFADVKGFSALATKVSPQELIAELDATFSKMDEISQKYNLERIKTIGDCYMACGGLPNTNQTHPFEVVLAALEIQHWMEAERQRRQGNFWQVRLGMHTGEAVAGVIGKTKFAYDVWGNTVNLASRMESGGEVGKINVTEDTYELVKDFFIGEYREEIEAKNIGKVKAYFITRLKPEYAEDSEGILPNERLRRILSAYNG